MSLILYLCFPLRFTLKSQQLKFDHAVSYSIVLWMLRSENSFESSKTINKTLLSCFLSSFKRIATSNIMQHFRHYTSCMYIHNTTFIVIVSKCIFENDKSFRILSFCIINSILITTTSRNFVMTTEQHLQRDARIAHTCSDFLLIDWLQFPFP